MNIDDILNKKGQFVSFITEKQMKVKKGQEPIIKHSEFVGRIGVEYDNMNSVKEKRDSGELPEENQGLPWGKWVNYPYTIEHNGNLYIRVSTTKNKSQKGKIKFYRNGIEISVEEAKQACLASEFPKNKSDLDIFNLNVDNIIKIK